ncbi:MAG: 6-carboxytetrahydropterin synthase [candidate division WOR-3 bacterium]|nr:MAG: 6-carboxytetrahydropterin synthase [candidate division WOR-3 bacterium]
MYTVRVTRAFSAAHAIRAHGGKCEDVHGHNYKVEVWIRSHDLSPPGMVADFVEVRQKLDSVLPDHKMLNEQYPFNPTTENLARHFFEEMSKFYRVSKVVVWENETSCAEYEAEAGP